MKVEESSCEGSDSTSPLIRLRYSTFDLRAEMVPFLNRLDNKVPTWIDVGLHPMGRPQHNCRTVSKDQIRVYHVLRPLNA